MFSSIFFFEVRRWLKAPATYVYFVILLLLSFLSGLAFGGAFPEVNVSTGSEKVLANAPVMIDAFFTGINNYIGLIIVVAVIGNSVLKDFRYNTYSLIYTTPVSKFNYLFGRFTASLFICLVILTGPAFGMMIAYATPWVDAIRVGHFVLLPYLQSYWQTVIPNVLLFGAIFFAVSLIARDIFVIWLSLIVVYVAIIGANTLSKSVEHEQLSALIDPLGAHAKYYLSKYWTADQKNHFYYSMRGVFFINRVIWLAVSVLVLITGYAYFSFSSSPRKVFGGKIRFKDNPIPVLAKSDLDRDALPKVNLTFGTAVYLKELLGLAVNECRNLLRNAYFRIILLFGLVLLLALSFQAGKVYDTATFPVTYEMVEFFGGLFNLFIVVLTIMFAGEVVWKAREFRMNNILDALPVPNWVFYVSKIIGLWFMQAILLLVIMLAGLIVQTFKGYTNYELAVYVQYLFGIKMIDYWLLAVLAVFVQTLVSNKYIGYFIMALFFIWNSTFAGLVLKHNIFVFNADPGIQYSAMNGFGHALYPFFIYKFYWSLLCLCLAVLSSLLWARGSETSLKTRLANASHRPQRISWIVAIAGMVVFLVCGGFIYYNTNISNKNLTDFQQEEAQANYEKKYKKFEHAAQPKITAVQVAVDLYPYQRGLHAHAIYIIQNKTTQPIDSIHVLLSSELKFGDLSFGEPYRQVLNDTVCDYRIYKLSKPMRPGDSLAMSFTVDMVQKGFKENFTGLGTPLYNGTFVNNEEFLPNIGYSSRGELADNNHRKKHGLGYRQTQNPITDTAAYKNNMLIGDADFIDFDATVSTVPDQIAIAPGYLQREWMENGRRYFHYKMDSKILNFYSFLSARYQVKKEKWNNVDLEIYYQKGHEYNLDRMFNGMKKALEYYSANFSPYQHKQARILEFPRYATFAQSFPNTIPFSEGIGFIADVDDSSKETLDYVFFVSAHEMAHQWFAHQVIGADVEGSNMLCETLAQYGATMVCEKEYGEDRVRKFLFHEMNTYLVSRSAEKEKEKPLAYVDMGQAYILYRKGGVVMHALCKYIGEDSLNHALHRFLSKYAFHGPPYPTTLDLISSIRQSTPDSLQYFVTDAFQKITLYDNRITEAKAIKTTGGSYTVNFTVSSKKIYADGAGAEKTVASNDYIEVGVYNKKRKALQLQMYKLKGGETKLSITVNEQPDKVMIDPRQLLIDKEMKDNEMKLNKNDDVAAK